MSFIVTVHGHGCTHAALAALGRRCAALSSRSATPAPFQQLTEPGYPAADTPGSSRLYRSPGSCHAC